MRVQEIKCASLCHTSRNSVNHFTWFPQVTQDRITVDIDGHPSVKEEQPWRNSQPLSVLPKHPPQPSSNTAPTDSTAEPSCPVLVVLGTVQQVVSLQESTEGAEKNSSYHHIQWVRPSSGQEWIYKCPVIGRESIYRKLYTEIPQLKMGCDLTQNRLSTGTVTDRALYI